MWQGTGSTNKWNLSCYSPRVQAILVGFRWFVRGGRRRQRQQWHLIPLPTRAGRWQMVWQGPRLGFVPETGRFVAMETLWVRFSCLLAFVPCFLLFVFRCSFLFFFSLHPGMLIFFVSLRLCSSHLLLSASTYFIVRVLSALCHLYPTPSRNYFIFYSSGIFFRSSYFSGGVFFLCSRTRYASTWFAYLDSLAFGFSLCLWPHSFVPVISLGWIRKDAGGTADVVG